LIGDTTTAKKLIHDTSAYCAKIRDAVLVFDQGYWQPDYSLWQAVQKVRLTSNDRRHRQSLADPRLHGTMSFSTKTSKLESSATTALSSRPSRRTKS